MFEAKTDMSITVAQMATALKATVRVVFDQSGQVAPDQGGMVDMVGGANTGYVPLQGSLRLADIFRSRYSLPGHVIISIPALPAGQSNKIREIRELKLVVEGKSEFYDDCGEFSSAAQRISLTSQADTLLSDSTPRPSISPNREHS